MNNANDSRKIKFKSKIRINAMIAKKLHGKLSVLFTVWEYNTLQVLMAVCLECFLMMEKLVYVFQRRNWKIQSSMLSFLDASGSPHTQFGFYEMTWCLSNLVFSLENMEWFCFAAYRFAWCVPWLATYCFLDVPLSSERISSESEAFLALVSFIEKFLHKYISIFLKC